MPTQAQRKMWAKSFDDILSQLSWGLYDEGYDDADFVIDQVVECPLHGKKVVVEANELARTRYVCIAATIVAGGKATNIFEVTIEPMGDGTDAD